MMGAIEEAKLAEEGRFNERSASGEMEKAIAGEMVIERQKLKLYGLPNERQVSVKTLDKRRKAAKQARKQRKRNR
jgi:hypothetical protein